MKKLILISIVALLLPAAFYRGKGSPVNGSLFFQLDPRWAANHYWYQGKAEVNFYNAQEVRYRVRRPAEVYHIIVTEKHKKDLLVKADDWRQPDLLDVFKFNNVITVPTGIYTYRQMLSLFMSRDELRAVKLTFGSQEWCGNTFKEIVDFGDRSYYDFNSYFDGEGHRRGELRLPPDVVFYDGLPVLLRALRFEVGSNLRFQMLPTQVSNRAPLPEVETASLRVLERAPIQVPAGKSEAYAVEVKHSRGADKFWFEAEFPNKMLRFERYDGALYELRKSGLLEYWRLNKPGDEVHLK